MSPDLNDQELRELLGAYALDALDDDERDQVEQFLLRDAAARLELHALQLGAAWVARSAPQPPERVWERIAAEVDHDLAGEEDDVVKILPATKATHSRRTRLLAVAAAVLAVVLAFGIVEIIGDQGQPAQSALAQAVRDAQRSPDARFVDLAAPDGSESARVVVLPDGQAYLTSTTLPRLEPSQTYQLWALTADGPVSKGVLGRRPGVMSFRVPRATSALAITAEPSGGSRAPHGLPVVIAPLVAT